MMIVVCGDKHFSNANPSLLSNADIIIHLLYFPFVVPILNSLIRNNLFIYKYDSPLSGSASTGSTKSSANMELYTHTASSSYNETMSGETLSSVSEKSCISNNVNGTHITPMSAAMAANGHIPYLVSKACGTMCLISNIFPAVSLSKYLMFFA